MYIEKKKKNKYLIDMPLNWEIRKKNLRNL